MDFLAELFFVGIHNKSKMYCHWILVCATHTSKDDVKYDQSNRPLHIIDQSNETLLYLMPTSNVDMGHLNIT